MANPFYDPGRQRAARVNELFDRIAKRYDLINNIQSLGLHHMWKRKVIRFVNPQTGLTYLDICCGTGDVLGSMPQGSLAIGLDFSQEMLGVAKRRLQESNTPLFRGDALHLPFQDSVFDGVTISYGLRNLADLERGLREIGRVLKPGGRVVILDFGKPRNFIVNCLYSLYLKAAVPLFGLLFAGNAAAYDYIYESLKHFPGQEKVGKIMQEMGFKGVQVHHLLFGMMGMNVGEKASNK